jgi:beta-lactamase class A
MLKTPPSRRLTFRARRRRRHWIAALLALAVIAAGAVYLTVFASGGALGGEEGRADPPGTGEERAPAASKENEPVAALEEPAAGEPEPAPEPAEPPDTPEEAAYLAVAPELPGVSPESIKAVYRSTINDVWASVHLVPSGEDKPYVVFTRRDGEVWEAEKSIRLDEPNYAANDLVSLGDVPKDLKDYLYPENAFVAEVPEPRQEKVDRGGLPDVGPAEFPPPEPVVEDVPGSEREKVEAALEEARGEIEDYGGVAGFYAINGEGGWGYGVRPDEVFFSASVIKVPVMVAVYRKIDEGELALSDSFETTEEDWAAGAGWLQWDEAGISHTVEDYLYMMMTQSDNVATNALIRRVGGADHVNEVARSLGAKDTLLYQKVSSERAAVPALDNRTTPRDMATMMSRIATGEAASDVSCKDMIDLMYQDELDWWLDAGLPEDVWAANKAGWLFKVYDEAGIVEDGDNPYVVAILSKYGPENVEEGQILIENLSRTVWEAQQDDPDKSGSEEDGSDDGSSDSGDPQGGSEGAPNGS